MVSMAYQIYVSAYQLFLGANGIENIVEIKLSDSEKAHLHTSAEGVKKTNSLLDV